jgi:guanylate kinase
MSEIPIALEDQILFVVSGPSGSGKESVMRRMAEQLDGIERIATYTTRAMRPGESEGQPYHFVAEAEFDRLLASGEIYEAETVYGSHRYGSPRCAAHGGGHGDLLIELDPNGYRRLRRERAGPTVGIFLLVPDLKTLEQRILARHSETDVAERLRIAERQIRGAGDYEYILMNDDLELCSRQAVLVCQAERIRRAGRALQRHFPRA